MRYALVLLALLVACTKVPDVPGPSPIVVPNTDDCGAMCEHLRDLGCEEGDPVFNSDMPGQLGRPNQSCEDFCRETQTNGVFLNPRCVKRVASCEAIETARKKVCQPLRRLGPGGATPWGYACEGLLGHRHEPVSHRGGREGRRRVALDPLVELSGGIEEVFRCLLPGAQFGQLALEEWLH
jgi:hypothetical protein